MVSYIPLLLVILLVLKTQNDEQDLVTAIHLISSTTMVLLYTISSILLNSFEKSIIDAKTNP